MYTSDDDEESKKPIGYGRLENIIDAVTTPNGNGKKLNLNRRAKKKTQPTKIHPGASFSGNTNMNMNANGRMRRDDDEFAFKGDEMGRSDKNHRRRQQQQQQHMIQDPLDTAFERQGGSSYLLQGKNNGKRRSIPRNSNQIPKIASTVTKKSSTMSKRKKSLDQRRARAKRRKNEDLFKHSPAKRMADTIDLCDDQEENDAVVDKIEGIKKDKKNFTQVFLDSCNSTPSEKSKRLKIIDGEERLVEDTSPRKQGTPQHLLDKENDSSSVDKIEGIKKDKKIFTQFFLDSCNSTPSEKSKRLKIIDGEERLVEDTSPRKQGTPQHLLDKENDSSSRRNRECSKMNEHSDRSEYPQALSHELNYSRKTTSPLREEQENVIDVDDGPDPSHYITKNGKSEKRQAVARESRTQGDDSVLAKVGNFIHKTLTFTKMNGAKSKKSICEL